MFGGVAAKVNGHIFAGLFGRSTMLLLPEPDRTEALALEGASLFDPMGDGRRMSDKVMLPEQMMDDAPELRSWIARAFAAAAAMPPKPAKASKPARAGAPGKASEPAKGSKARRAAAAKKAPAPKTAAARKAPTPKIAAAKGPAKRAKRRRSDPPAGEAVTVPRRRLLALTDASALRRGGRRAASTTPHASSMTTARCRGAPRSRIDDSLSLRGDSSLGRGGRRDSPDDSLARCSDRPGRSATPFFAEATHPPAAALPVPRRRLLFSGRLAHRRGAPRSSEATPFLGGDSPTAAALPVP